MTSAAILFLFLFALGVLLWGHWRPAHHDAGLDERAARDQVRPSGNVNRRRAA